MRINTLCLENPAAADTHVQYAIQLKVPESADGRRIPTHFILVLDVSESMLDRNKLENVKHSASLVLKFLGPTDYMSIITFGDAATIQANAILCDSTGKSTLETILQTIRADGCTNLSGGLIHIKTVMDTFTAPVKTGVLLLTDGHANRGAYRPDGLKTILQNLHEQFPGLSFNFMAYGTDHNAELLKEMAEHTQGGYSIVENLEGATTVIGDTLGNLFSCKAQMVCAQTPPGTNTLGQYPVDAAGRMEIGDLYEGSETILLLSIPKGECSKPISIKGIHLPSLQSFTHEVTLDPWTDTPQTPNANHFRISVELTTLRYECSRLFRCIRQNELTGLLDRIRKFRERIFQEEFNGNSVASMLREECGSLEAALESAQTRQHFGGRRSDFLSQVMQHEAYTHLGRGATVAVQQPRGEDPVNFNTTSYVTSPFASRTARRVVNLISTISIAPNDMDAVNEATQMSQNVSQVDDAHN